METATEENGLESKITASLAIGGLAISLILISPNLTGNAVGNLARESSNILGVVSFIIGLVGAFLYKKIFLQKLINSFIL